MKLTDDSIETLIRTIISGMCSNPNRLSVKNVSLNSGDHISISCHPKDFPRIIGKGGITYGAISTIASAYAEKNGRSVQVHVENPKTDAKPKPEPFVINPRWDGTVIVGIAKAICAACLNHGGTVKIVDLNASQSVMEIQISKREELRPFLYGRDNRQMQVDEAVRIILTAWGKNNGRDVTVEVCKMPI